VALLVIPGEQIVSYFKAARDSVVFTDKRLIAVNVQGMTGKKRDFISLRLDSRATLTSASLGTWSPPTCSDQRVEHRRIRTFFNSASHESHTRSQPLRVTVMRTARRR
jgi:TPP-dependent trihydroxycyclohexane-1,2-dione (THcHDO) dehydratase